LVDWYIGIADSQVDVKSNDHNTHKYPCDELGKAFQSYQMPPSYSSDVVVFNGEKW
jgi:hypothetical protein